MSLKPWKSDIAKGTIVSYCFFAGVWLGIMIVLMPAAIQQIIEMGYYYGQGWLIIIASLWVVAGSLYAALYTLNREFVWKGR